MLPHRNLPLVGAEKGRLSSGPCAFLFFLWFLGGKALWTHFQFDLQHSRLECWHSDLSVGPSRVFRIPWDTGMAIHGECSSTDNDPKPNVPWCQLSAGRICLVERPAQRKAAICAKASTAQGCGEAQPHNLCAAGLCFQEWALAKHSLERLRGPEAVGRGFLGTQQLIPSSKTLPKKGLP